MGKIALITGITGQDGSFLAEILLEKGYKVHGIVRRSSTEKRERIQHLEGNGSHPPLWGYDRFFKPCQNYWGGKARRDL